MYQEILELKLLDEIKDIDLAPMITAIDSLKEKEYWETKNKRLKCLKDSEEIATILLINSIGFNIQIQELIGRIAHKISSNCSYTEKIQNASDIIEACDNTFYEVIIGQHIMVESFYNLEPETYEYIALRTYQPPMVVKPRDWISNDDGGYYDTPIHCILGSTYNQHSKPQALDILNTLQSIEWKLNPTILGLEEQPNKQFKSITSHEQFMQMASDSQKTYSEYKDRKFWFIWQFDKRGRMYSKGYHINIQASGYKKALLDFAELNPIEGEL